MSCNFCSSTKTPCDRQDCPFTKVYGPYLYEDGISQDVIPYTELQIMLGVFRKPYYMAALLKGRNRDGMIQVHKTMLTEIECRRENPLQGLYGVVASLRGKLDEIDEQLDIAKKMIDKLLAETGQDVQEDEDVDFVFKENVSEVVEAQEKENRVVDLVWLKKFEAQETENREFACVFCLLTSTTCYHGCPFARLYASISKDVVTELERLLNCFTLEFLKKSLLASDTDLIDPDLIDGMFQVHFTLLAEVRYRGVSPIRGISGLIEHLRDQIKKRNEELSLAMQLRDTLSGHLHDCKDI